MTIVLRGITKRFGDVLAVDDVTLDIREGEVLALLGENGAGKSTLMKILYGMLVPDRGQILADETPLQLGSPKASRAAGIGMVFQQWSLISSLTIAENLMLAWPKAPYWIGPRSGAWDRVIANLALVAPELDPNKLVADISVGHKQLIELCKVLNLDARLVILDEPTSVLAQPEAERLWEQIRALSRRGVAVVLITHKMQDVVACADRVVVMRAGKIVGETQETRAETQLVAWMMGQIPVPPSARKPTAKHSPRLSVQNVVAFKDGAKIQCASLTVAKGEILGIAGVTGNGQELLGRLLAGVQTPDQGEVLVDGRNVAKPPEQTTLQPVVAYIPEQPFVNGCAAELTLLTNLTALGARSLSFLPKWKLLRDIGARLLDTFDVRPRNLDMLAGQLSGGNLQKLVLARELTRVPALVVACYPTMGLDVVAAQFVVEQLLACADAGAAVVWISEDLDVLLQHADKVAVLRTGQLKGPVMREATTRQQIGAWMTGAAA